MKLLLKSKDEANLLKIGVRDECNKKRGSIACVAHLLVNRPTSIPIELVKLLFQKVSGMDMEVRATWAECVNSVIIW